MMKTRICAVFLSFCLLMWTVVPARAEEIGGLDDQMAKTLLQEDASDFNTPYTVAAPEAGKPELFRNQSLENRSTVNTSATIYPVEGGCLYFDKETGIITGCDESVTAAEIPDEIEGIPVTDIGLWAFADCSRLVSLHLPASLGSIQGYAFENCSSLVGPLIIPSGVTYIGNAAFRNCSSLMGPLVVPDGVTSIKNYTFEGCSALTGIHIPDTVTEIGGYAFARCSVLSEIHIPGAVTEIGAYAFYNCGNLSSVNLPNSVTNIGKCAFFGCESLASVSTSRTGINVGDEAFYRCDGLTQITLTGAGSSAFAYCSKLKEVTFMDDSTEIGSEAFSHCYELESVYLPRSIDKIGERAFYWCYSLKDISIPSHARIDEGVFAGCSSLGSIPIVPTTNSLVPAESCNKNGNVYQHTLNGSYYGWTDTAKSYLYQNGEHICRIEYIDGQIIVETYSRDFQLMSSLSLENDLCAYWGGFFSGKIYNFIILGFENPSADDNAEVIRIIKYDKTWNKLDQASLYGGQTHTGVPFGGVDKSNPGAVSCAESGGMLYIHTCHLMYISHQANLTISLREDDMTITDAGYLDNDTISADFGYVSHSLNQHILIDQNQNIVTLDHGDAHPNSIYLQRYNKKAGDETFTGGCTGITIQDINRGGGSSGGLAETSDAYVTAFNYTSGSNSSYPRNVYISFTSKSNFSEIGTITIPLTSYSPDDEYSAGTPILIPTNFNEGYILWTVLKASGHLDQTSEQISYAKYFADGSVSNVTTTYGALSDCQPIVIDGQAIWYVTEHSVPSFYVLDQAGLTIYSADMPTRISKVTIINNAIEAEIYCSNQAPCIVYCVFYNKKGQMLSTEVAPLSAGENVRLTFTIVNGMSKAKIFVLNKNYVPQCVGKSISL